MSAPLTGSAGERYLRAVDTFRSSAFRLETRQSYPGGEDAALAAFLAGEARPPLDRGDLDYLGAVRAARARGARWQRVHVVREPLTDYLRFELTWEYGPNVDAGEEVGLVVVGEGSAWPRALPRDVDFWLFDDELLFELHYAADGQWLGIEQVEAATRVAAARRWRAAALEQSRSWAGYLAAHPTLGARVPTMRAVS